MITGFSTCSTCGAPIYWLKHVRTGLAAPINAEPDAGKGNCLVNLEAGVYEALGAKDRAWRESAGLLSETTPLYLNHFMTCPQRRFWAKAGRRTR